MAADILSLEGQAGKQCTEMRCGIGSWPWAACQCLLNPAFQSVCLAVSMHHGDDQYACICMRCAKEAYLFKAGKAADVPPVLCKSCSRVYKTPLSLRPRLNSQAQDLGCTDLCLAARPAGLLLGPQRLSVPWQP